jgi:hypothetical protein
MNYQDVVYNEGGQGNNILREFKTIKGDLEVQGVHTIFCTIPTMHIRTWNTTRGTTQNSGVTF